MTTPLAFERLLALVDDRSAALVAAVTDAADTTVRVPSCPDWTLRQLVEHITEVQFFWAGAVTAGPAAASPAARLTSTAPDLLDRFQEATGALLTALRAAGADRSCWAWWGASDVPLTAGSVARHQVQEAAVHAYDAQEAAGRPEPLPDAVALDGVDEFAAVSFGTAGAWPGKPARVGLYAAEGAFWEFDLTEAGAAGACSDTPVDAGLHGTASDLVLALYRRVPLDRLRVEGDPEILERLLAWCGED
ncbi:maleylpyruvate isomerase family mycothiol-dependent enzyme [Streptomyces fuscigenes]|uniref:maleylpyruvate isomerase family mycothiol-dependent enzyme n=1 Tax=Streptomyces fuscigenes TaxID=1528880 RepID=UPI001F3DC3C0|nr:maleylpyruvate isomerase family mycothiol-dependent enzyme [Streptomyces fuscigenes]MCF3961297.1 maleylpyruvate isomerase family mycothiol-dependent enzyme [Streptomyces fuscigenes]